MDFEEIGPLEATIIGLGKYYIWYNISRIIYSCHSQKKVEQSKMMEGAKLPSHIHRPLNLLLHKKIWKYYTWDSEVLPKTEGFFAGKYFLWSGWTPRRLFM